MRQLTRKEKQTSASKRHGKPRTRSLSFLKTFEDSFNLNVPSARPTSSSGWKRGQTRRRATSPARLRAWRGKYSEFRTGLTVIMN